MTTPALTCPRPSRMRGKHVLIEHVIDLGRQDECREPFQEFDRLEQEVGGPVMPGRLQRHQRLSVGSEMEAGEPPRPGWSAIKRETAARHGNLVDSIEDRTLRRTDYSPAARSNS